MAFIGQVSALFTASTGGLVKGVDTVKQKLNTLGSSANKAAGQAGVSIDAMADSFGKLPFGIGSGIKSIQSMTGGLSALRGVAAAAGGGLGGLAGGVAAVAGPLGIAAAGAATAAAAMYGMGKALDALEDRVETIQKAAERMGTSFLETQVLQTAAEQNQSSLQALEGATKKLAKAMQGVEEGSDKAVQAFSTLGIAQEELQGLGTVERLQLVAGKLNEIEDPAVRATAAMQLFGKGGLAILPVLAALEKTERNVRTFGATLSAVDVERISLMGDSFDELEIATQGLGQVILKPFTTLAEGVNGIFSGLIGFFNNVFDPIAGGIADLLTPIAVIGRAVGRLTASFGRAIGIVLKLSPLPVIGRLFAQAWRGAGVVIDKLLTAMENGLTVVEKWLSKIPFIGGMFAGPSEDAARLAAEQDRVAESAEFAAEINEKYGDKTKEIAKQIEDINFLLEQNAKAAAEGADTQFIDPDAAAAALEDLSRQLEELRNKNIQTVIDELGLKLETDVTPIEQYQNAIARLGELTAETASGEQMLADARAAASKQLLDSLPTFKETATPFEEMQKKLEELDAAAAGLSPIDNAAELAEIERRRVGIRQEFLDKELESEQSRSDKLTAQLEELQSIEEEFAGDDSALAGIREKREKIEKELSEIGKAAADAIAKDRDRVNTLLGRPPDKELGEDIEAINNERKRAQAAFDEAMAAGNRAAADQAEARLAELEEAESKAQRNARDRELDRAGVGDLLKPKVTDETQVKALAEFRDAGKISDAEFTSGLQRLFEDARKMEEEIAMELETPVNEQLKGSDVRSSEGIAEYIRLATGREDPALQQRREQLAKLASIETLLRDAGVQPAEILGG